MLPWAESCWVWGTISMDRGIYNGHMCPLCKKSIHLFIVLLMFWVSNFRMGRWGEVPHTSKEKFSGTSRESKDSSQFWHYLLGDSIRLHRLSAESYKAAPLHPLIRLQPLVTSPSCDPHFWPNDCKSESLRLHPWVWIICCRGSQNSGKHFIY